MAADRPWRRRARAATGTGCGCGPPSPPWWWSARPWPLARWCWWRCCGTRWSGRSGRRPACAARTWPRCSPPTPPAVVRWPLTTPTSCSSRCWTRAAGSSGPAPRPAGWPRWPGCVPAGRSRSSCRPGGRSRRTGSSWSWPARSRPRWARGRCWSPGPPSPSPRRPPPSGGCSRSGFPCCWRWWPRPPGPWSGGPWPRWRRSGPRSTRSRPPPCTGGSPTHRPTTRSAASPAP